MAAKKKGTPMEETVMSPADDLPGLWEDAAGTPGEITLPDEAAPTSDEAIFVPDEAASADDAFKPRENDAAPDEAPTENKTAQEELPIAEETGAPLADEALLTDSPMDEMPLDESVMPVIDNETAPEQDENVAALCAEGSQEPEQKSAAAAPRVARMRPSAKQNAPVLTIESRGEIETQADREDVVWHEIHNAYRTRRLLTGQLGGMEQTESGKTIAVVDYKGFRVAIPLSEMMIGLGGTEGTSRRAQLLRQTKILGNMLGAQIDFVVKGIDSKTRSIVASRQDAMRKKRRVFYFGTDANGAYRIHEGRIVQARVIAAGEKGIRVEAFGAECTIPVRDLAWEWIGDARERYAVGDEILIRIQNVRREGTEDVAIRADVRSVLANSGRDALRSCCVQGKYTGRVTDVRKGVVFIRLSNGVNAIAHSCFDYRTPGKKDDVSFAVTHIDEERCVAVGIITRIIRQNL